MSRSILSTLWRVALVGALALGLSIEMQATSGSRDPDLRMEIGAPELPAPAVSTTIYLANYPKFTSANAKKRLAELFTVAEAKAAFPDLWRAYAGQTDAYIMSLALFNGGWTQALWTGVPDPAATGGNLTSRNEIVVPLGAWWFNDELVYSYGTYRFPNAGTGNAEWGGDIGGCELLRWHEAWVGPTTTRNGELICFGASHGGSDGLLAYSEGTTFEGAFRINGRCGNWRDPSKPVVVGFEAWDFGEASGFQRIFAHYCDIGKRVARGTPFNASGTVSAFSNTLVGVQLMNVGNANFTTVSMDDNPRGLEIVGGYGRPATANVNIGSIKGEAAVTGKDQGRTWKPQAHRFTGRFKVTIGLVTQNTGMWMNALFILEPNAALGPSALEVKMFDVQSMTGTEVLVHDVVAGVAWKYDPRIVGFKWSNATGVSVLESWPVQAEKINAPHKNQLGYFESNPTTGASTGTMDRVNGTPTWSDVTGNGGTVTPTPPTTPSNCSYTYSAWSTCTNGTQTRTFTSTAPAGCVGTPVLSQTCSTPTPAPTLIFATTFSGSGPNLVATKGTAIAPSSGSTATFTSGVITTNANTKYPWASGRAQRIVLLGVTLKAAPAYQHLTANHVVYPDGRIFYRTVYNNPGADVDTGLKLTLNTKVTSLSLPCPGGILNTVIGSPVGAGNGAPLTIEALEVWQ